MVTATQNLQLYNYFRYIIISIEKIGNSQLFPITLYNIPLLLWSQKAIAFIIFVYKCCHFIYSEAKMFRNHCLHLWAYSRTLSILFFHYKPYLRLIYVSCFFIIRILLL